jgi:hypothetical protein
MTPLVAYLLTLAGIFVALAAGLLICWLAGEDLPTQDPRCTAEDLVRIAGQQLDGPTARRWGGEQR